VYSECLPFTGIPHSSRLFLDYLYNLDRVRRFYAHPPLTRDWLPEQAAKVRARYAEAQRQAVANALLRQNRAWNAPPEVISNLGRLRNGALAVVTGQQVGVLGGPLYSFYKALSAVKVAAEYTAAGVESAPIFWLATEDHDFAEVSHAFLADEHGEPHRIEIASTAPPDAPVGSIRLGAEINSVLRQVEHLIGPSILEQAYAPGQTLGSAFARLLMCLFGRFGLIVLDPLDSELHQLAAPLLGNAARRADELHAGLDARGKELEASGYHAQVKVAASSSLLFSLAGGRRVAIRRSNSHFVVGDRRLTAAEFAAEVEAAPEQFSPNALLRPAMQDFLLPSVAVIAGPAEIAYWAQVAVLEDKLLGGVTPALPRFSATLVEPRCKRLLDRYQARVADLFKGVEHTRELLAGRSLPSKLEETYRNSAGALDALIAAYSTELLQLDPTLSEAASRAAAKMRYQLQRLHVRAARAGMRRHEDVVRHADRLSAALYPNKTLQERVVAGVSFVARYGPDVLDALLDVARPQCPDHQVVYL